MDAAELVGREAELGLLRERLAGARAGRGGVVLLSGEAGIGKSALAAMVAADAKALGFALEQGRAWEWAEAPAWFPVRGCLRALGIEAARLPAVDHEVYSLWEEALEGLARASRTVPQLWLLEDLHAADARTLDLIAYLAQPIRSLPVLLLVTVRTGDARVRGSVLERLTHIGRDGQRIDLAPLAPEACEKLLARLSGKAVRPAALGEWMTRTGGNPLFLTECARALRAGSTREKLPSTVLQVVRERLLALPSGTRQMLELAAVIEQELVASTLARMSERMPAAVIDELLPALKAGLLHELAPGRFRFSHALVREAIYEGLEPERRRAAHQSAEAAIALLGDTPERAVERAWHALAALGAMPEPRVGERVGAALSMLESQGAHDRAYRLWQRWIEARSRPPSADDLVRSTRLAIQAGVYSEARKHGEAALALAREQKQPITLAEAALAIGADIRPAVVDHSLVRALEEALAGLPEEQRALRCRLRARLSAALQPAADPMGPVVIGRQVIAEARSTKDPALLREVLYVAGSALCEYVPPDESRALAEELLEGALATGEDERALRALARLAISHLDLGAWSAFDTTVARLLELARRTGHPRLVWRPLLIASMAATARGRVDESERLVVEVEELARLTDDPALMMSLHAHRLMRLFSLDLFAEAQQTLNMMGPHLPGPEQGAVVRPVVHALFGLRFEDRDQVRAQLPDLMGAWLDQAGTSGFQGVAGEAAAYAGSREECQRLYDLLLPRRSHHLHMGHVPYVYEGPVERVLGLLAARLARPEEGLERLSAVIEQCRAFGLRPWLARTLIDRGQALASLGRREEAERDGQEAEVLAMALHMPSLAAHASSLARDRSAPPAEIKAAPEPARPAALALFAEAELWRVCWNGHEARVRDSRGMQMLARLVAAPNERMHALVLSGGEEAQALDGHAGDALDATALRAYRGRLQSLDQALEEAEACADLGRVAALQQEQAALESELSRAVGLGGRTRKSASITERARVNVTRRLRDALARIAEADPAIGQHLEAALRTGAYCLYRP